MRRASDSDGVEVTGLASPSRGCDSRERLARAAEPGRRAPEHTLTSDEAFVALRGSARVELEGEAARAEGRRLPGRRARPALQHPQRRRRAVRGRLLHGRRRAGGRRGQGAFVPPWAAYRGYAAGRRCARRKRHAVAAGSTPAARSCGSSSMCLPPRQAQVLELRAAAAAGPAEDRDLRARARRGRPLTRTRRSAPSRRGTRGRRRRARSGPTCRGPRAPRSGARGSSRRSRSGRGEQRRRGDPARHAAREHGRHEPAVRDPRHVDARRVDARDPLDRVERLRQLVEVAVDRPEVVRARRRIGDGEPGARAPAACSASPAPSARRSRSAKWSARISGARWPRARGGTRRIVSSGAPDTLLGGACGPGGARRALPGPGPRRAAGGAAAARRRGGRGAGVLAGGSEEDPQAARARAAAMATGRTGGRGARASSLAPRPSSGRHSGARRPRARRRSTGGCASSSGTWRFRTPISWKFGRGLDKPVRRSERVAPWVNSGPARWSRCASATACASSTPCAQRGAISRSDIARQTGLSRSTVSSLVADLQAEGMVIEREVDGVAARPRRAGARRCSSRSTSPPAPLLGIDFGHDSRARRRRRPVATSILAESHAEIEVDTGAATRRSTPPPGSCRATARGGRRRPRPRARRGHGPARPDRPRERPRALAARSCPSLDGHRPRRRDGGAPRACPSTSTTTPTSARSASRRSASGAGADVMAYLRLSAGIGAGLVIDGRPFRGARGVAGEIGHVLVDPQGPICRCGNRGCLETFASPARAVRAAAPLARPHDRAPSSCGWRPRATPARRRVIARRRPRRRARGGRPLQLPQPGPRHRRRRSLRRRRPAAGSDARGSAALRDPGGGRGRPDHRGRRSATAPRCSARWPSRATSPTTP